MRFTQDSEELLLAAAHAMQVKEQLVCRVQVATLILLLAWQTAGAPSSTSLVPGLVYFDGKEKLTGRIIFLVSTNTWSKRMSAGPAAIMEFDLERGALRQIVVSHDGVLARPDDGRLFCVGYDSGGYGPRKADVFWTGTGRHYSVNLQSDALHTIILNNRVFFWCSDPTTYRRIIVEYDPASESQRVVPTPDGSLGEDGNFEFLHTHEGVTNALFFRCSPPYGLPRQERRFDFGLYRYDFHSRAVEKATNCSYRDGLGADHKADNGRFIFFEGENFLSGGKLVSSSVDAFELQLQKPRNAKVRVLKTFAEPAKLPLMASYYSGGAIPAQYWFHSLAQISPCRHYAFIVKGEQALGDDACTYSYSIVDCSSGKMRTLFKTQATKAGGQVSSLYWLGPEAKEAGHVVSAEGDK